MANRWFFVLAQIDVQLDKFSPHSLSGSKSAERIKLIAFDDQGANEFYVDVFMDGKPSGTTLRATVEGTACAR